MRAGYVETSPKHSCPRGSMTRQRSSGPHTEIPEAGLLWMSVRIARAGAFAG